MQYSTVDTTYTDSIHDKQQNMHLTKRRRVWGISMEGFRVLCVWGFRGDSHRFLCGYGMGMGIEIQSPRMLSTTAATRVYARIRA